MTFTINPNFLAMRRKISEKCLLSQNDNNAFIKKLFDAAQSCQIPKVSIKNKKEYFLPMGRAKKMKQLKVLDNQGKKTKVQTYK